MIINHQYRFIFFKTRKVGGTSLELALSRYCGPGDVITPISSQDEKARRALGYQRPVNCWKSLPGEWALRDLVNLVYKRRRPLKFYNHMSAVDARHLIADETWNSYHKFTICRNPWDRMASTYRWLRTKRPDVGAMSMEQFLEKPWVRPPSTNWQQYTENDQLLVDQVIRYEALEAGLRELGEITGLPADLYQQMKQFSAKSSGPHAAGAADAVRWSRAAIERVREDAEAEISRFGYRPPEPD